MGLLEQVLTPKVKNGWREEFTHLMGIYRTSSLFLSPLRALQQEQQIETNEVPAV